MFDLATRRLIALTLGVCLAPLLLQLPRGSAIAIALTAVLVTAWSWRRTMPGLLKILLAMAVVGTVLISFQFHMGRDTGCALLAAMLAIKPAETRTLRDARSLAGFALFAPFSAFLLDQGPASLLLGLAAAACGLILLQRLADIESGIDVSAWSPALRMVGKLALIGLPLALAAFWLFPRIASPLWGVPDRASAKTGLSDSMSPGGWLDLMADDSPALRVRFDGATPATSQMYWRGPVLWDFDGRTWTRQREEGMGWPMPAVQSRDVTWSYQMEVEPTERRDLVALDLPTSTPTGSLLTRDYNLILPNKLQAVTRWQVQSSPPLAMEADLPARVRARALRFPRDYNPRAQHLARQWREQAGNNDGAIVESALTMIRASFTYSLEPPMLGRDGIDDFLFNTKIGYCEHYSSAFVFLMRAAGVPARVVTGYAGGYRNPVGDYWIVRNSDAHAWAEVWLPQRGWVRVDPTAAVAPERIYDTVADRMPGNIFGLGGSAALTQAWNWLDYARRGWNDFVLGFNADRQSKMFQWAGLDKLDGSQLVILFALCAGLALLWMAWLLTRAERERDPLLRAWHAMTQRYARFGLAREPSEAANDWAERVAHARPQDADTLRSIAQRFSQWRYAGEGELAALTRALKAHRPAR